MSNIRSLGDVLESISVTHKFDKDKLIFLNTSDVLEGTILIDNYMNVADMKGQAKKTIQNDDILFSEIRPKNKRYAFVSVHNPEDYVVSTKLMVLRNKTRDVLTKYIYYFLTYEGTLNYLQMRAENRIGSFPQITFDIVKEINLNVPDKTTQQKIVDILTDLDAKIELNQRINAELESMAKTVFRYQFVENKEKVNWKIGTLGDVAENIRRSANPSDISPNTHYIGLEHMPRKSIALSEYESASKVESNKYAFKTGEFLFGKLRPYFHKVGIAPVDGVCSTDILVIAPKSPEWYGFVLGHVSSDEIIKYADATSGGTKMPRTNWESLERFEISLPPVKIAKEFSEFFVPVAKQIRTNILESQTLTELRDWLLPMLMNGQVTVNGF